MSENTQRPPPSSGQADEVEMLAKFPAENPNPVLRVGGNGVVQYHNSAGVPLLAHWRNSKDEPLPERWRQLVTDALREGKPKQAEAEYDGNTLSLTFAPVVESGFVNVYGLDITERKQTEAQMRREKQFTESALDAQLDTFFLFDPATGKAVRWNRAFRDISGYTDEEIANLPAPVSYYSPGDLERATACIQGVLKEGAATVELELVCKDGHRVPTEYRVSAILDDSGQPAYLIAIGRDMTERKEAETALSASEKKFRGYIDYITAGVVAHAPDTSILYCNRRAMEILGLTLDEMLGKTAIDPQWKFLNEDGTDMVLGDFPIQRALHSRQNLDDYMLGIVRPDRDYVTWVVCSSFAVRDEEGIVNHILITFFDITERKQAEERERQLQERLARAERMESVGVLAGGIAHDLNNLLCPNVLLPKIILADLEDVTQAQCKNIDTVRENLDAIEQCSLSAAEAIKDISILSRSHVQPKAPLNINDAVTRYLKSREFKGVKAAHPNASFNISLDRGDPWISGTQSHVDRLLSNLVRNAVLAIENEGVVTIRTSAVSVEDPIVGYELIHRGDYVVLEIGDTGVGIERKALMRVFEPFFTTRKQASRAGSGLGLSVVHGIVKNHGGTIDVQTELGEGTIFSLYFPVVESPPTQAEPPEDTVRGGTERILVVDDEPSQILIATQALKRQGYSVDEAANGREAIALFEQANATGGDSPFDLVVLDMLMEVGLDGLTTYREIIKLYPGQKAVIVSGYAGDASAGEEARALGVDWLTKPYQAADIARAVRKRLDRNTT